MRSDRAYLEVIAQLHKTTDPGERQVAWRQGLAALAAIAADREPAPLEGLSAAALLASARAAAESRLYDDLGFLSPVAAGRALFELASALPAGGEKRELGRMVLRRVYDGDSPTFVALATMLATSGGRLPEGPSRVRVALALAAPVAESAAVDGLALALVSRRDLEREWLIGPSTGALPSRRLAAQLIERATREAVRRRAGGDASGASVFERARVREVWDRLLADREFLVWRHVAAARGLLARAIPRLMAEVDEGLSPAMSTTEWRRSVASLAAGIAIDPSTAGRVRELLRGSLVRRDAGVARALVVGLGNAFVVEPETADLVAAEAVEVAGLEAVEGVAELCRDAGDAIPAGGSAIAAARMRIARELAGGGSEARRALLSALESELSDAPGETIALHGPLVGAMRVAHDGDFAGGREVAEQVIERARAAIDRLGAPGTGLAERVRLVREIDHALLEQDLWRQLWPAAGEDRGGGAALAPHLARLEDWLLATEARPQEDVELRLQLLRALVHLFDREPDGAPENQKTRRLDVVRSLLALAGGNRTSLRRALWAALARACDGLLRDNLVEFSDVLLGLTSEIDDADDLSVLEEASMLPELSRVLAAHRTALRRGRRAAEMPEHTGARRAGIASLQALASALPPGTARRVDALRVALLRVASSLARIDSAPNLAALSGEIFELLDNAARTIGELTGGARRRMGLPMRTLPFADPTRAGDMNALVAAVREAADGDATALGPAIDAVAARLGGELPAPVALVARATLASLASASDSEWEDVSGVTDLTYDGASSEPELPDWIPASRTLGGFHVQRRLGSGAGGSVFLACRIEERHAPDAELFALKVPDYDGGAARSLSEEEFSRMFREEARALLSLPAHPNLAGFVTFDAGARPKPILVMELVRGSSLENLLDRGELSCARALALLDGIAAGLEAMHAGRIAHLDVKPANVILREPDPGMAVLVDFGLAGRSLRPGCGSPYYGAPEVWKPAGDPPPEPADVYAFACLAYEVFAAQPLVNGPTPVAVVTAHLTGTAGREPLRALGAAPGLAPLAQLIQSAIVREPSARPTIGEMRRRLAALAPGLTGRPWPLGVGA